MAKNLSEQLTDFMENYRKAKKNFQDSEEIKNALGGILAPEEPQSRSSDPRSMDSRVNTIIGAIRDNLFTPKGMSSMLGDYRRNQAIEALDPYATFRNKQTSPQMTPKVPQGIESTIFPDGRRMRSVGYDTDTDTMYFQYMKGDTFGDVIKELGLQTKNGLWGPNGDVEYYTQQLKEQGIDGNIPEGTVIKLRRRK